MLGLKVLQLAASAAFLHLAKNYLSKLCSFKEQAANGKIFIVSIKHFFKAYGIKT